MTWFAFFILSLAVLRVSFALVGERGPADIFLRIRQAAGIKHDEDLDPSEWPDRYLPNLLTCFYCTSLTLSVIIFLLWIPFHTIVVYLSLPFAIAGAVMLAYRLAGW